MAMLCLLMIFGLSGYVSARAAKTHELCWGLLWTVFTALFITGVAWWGNDAVRWRLPMPSVDMGWRALLLIAFYCLAPIAAASKAEDVNQKKKPDKAEVVAEMVQDAAETIHDLFKHH